MSKDVISAVYRGNYRIELAFEDGKSGVVDFLPYLDQQGVFERFRMRNFSRIFMLIMRLVL
ncbi:DUF2442 domain-containing protein [Desulfonatronum parangueonense]